MRRRKVAARALDHPLLSGAVIIVVLATAVFVSWSAQNGLPFQPTYRIAVAIPDAAQLTKNADVRVAGARVGQVLGITAMPPSGGRPPYARLQLALSPSAGPLPRDTTVQLRLSSVLGGKYVELRPGRSRARVPDGGSLPLRNAIPSVGLDEAFRAFDAPARRDLTALVDELGGGVAGRGGDLNSLMGSTRAMLGPLDRVLGVLAEPRTDLAGLLRGAASFTTALQPVAGALDGVFAGGARTFAALDAAGPSLGQTIDALGPTEAQGTTTLRRLRPVLADAAAIARALRPGARLLPVAATRLDALTRSAARVLRSGAETSPVFDATFAAVEAFAAEPSAIRAFQALGDNDLATFGASAFDGLGAIIHVAAQAQLRCNVLALWLRNLSSAMSEGDSGGTWIRMLMVVNNGQGSQQPAPSPDLHLNAYPNENAHECEAGNEPYLPGQSIGNPPGDQSTKVDMTQRPPTGGGG